MDGLIRQLQGAVEAIALLRERSPEMLDAFFASMELVSTEDVSDRAKKALEAMADELRMARRLSAGRPISSRHALRLAYSAEGRA